MTDIKFSTPEDTLTPDLLSEGTVLLIDKPLGWSSFDALNRIKVKAKYVWGIPKLKIGHAGTLDPLATGLLVVCTGRMTKQIEGLQARTKVYTGTMVLGAVTDSYDLETAPRPSGEIGHILMDDIRQAALRLTGIQSQHPPIFSAIKKDGKRLYEHARAGRTVETQARQVQIDRFDIVDYQPPVLSFEVVCGKGVYIRSLAHDLGGLLGCGAHLSALRRTANGEMHVGDAWTVDGLIAHMEANPRLDT